MATAKKPQATKKSNNKIVKARPLTWKFYVTTIGIFVVAVTTFIVMALFTAQFISSQQSKARLTQIQNIYSSLQINQDEFRLADANVFGDKRVYSWDKNRTHSSVVQYIRGDTVENTFNELDAKIRTAGFTFVDEPYPGSSSKQYHYKSNNGEYIRLTVSSKLYDDAVLNASILNQSVAPEFEQIEALSQQAPANVVIKVNLDDNNE